MAHRIIHGMFVNPKGGESNNYQNDLQQEHIVKDHKVILTYKETKLRMRLPDPQQYHTASINEQSNISKDSTAHTYGDCI